MGSFIRPARFGSAFSAPDDLPNLTAWYDASDSGTITSSGGNVSQWDDKSGNGHDLTKPSFGNEPSTGVDTLNSLNVLTFADGEKLAHYLATGGVVDSNMTMYAVFIHDGGSTYDGAPCMIADISGYGHPMDRYDSEYYSNTVRIGGGAWNDIGAESTAAVWCWTVDKGGPTDSGAHVHSEYKNGTLLKSGTGNTSWVVNATYLTVGGRPGAANFVGKLAEVCIYDDLHSSGDRGDVETYLTDKWIP